jgi:hypothetical protein
VSDGQILRLIKLWLSAAVEETDDRGHRHRTTRNKREGRGVPQGAPISPLLSNLYMRRFVLGWKVLGHEKHLDAHIVNYADDFVICCRGTAEQAMTAMRAMMSRLKLTVNEEKTTTCHLPGETFNFLGYTVGRCHSPKTGRTYLGTWPSKARVQRVCTEITAMTSRRQLLADDAEMVARLNRVLRGWSNYFCLGPVSKAYRAVDVHARTRLRRWLCRKHKGSGRGYSRYPDEHLYEALGLVRLPALTHHLPWAKA